MFELVKPHQVDFSLNFYVMKNILSIITFFIGLCFVTGCGPSKAEVEAQRRADSIRIADSIRVLDSIRIADSTRVADSIAHDQKIIQFITNMYNHEKYNDDGFLHEHCTSKMIKVLRDNYDYECDEGDCLAGWIFRSDSDDAYDMNKYGIISVTPIGNNWYQYVFYDRPHKASRSIKVIDVNGKIMIDGWKKK